MKNLLPYIFLLFAHQVLSQQAKIDSLRNNIQTAAADTNKVNTMNALVKLYWQTSVYDSALLYAKRSKELSDKLGFKKGSAAALNNMGIVYWRQGNFPEALRNYFAALKIAEEMRDKRKMGAIYGNIGNINIQQGELDQALKYELLSVKYATESGDKKILSNSYNSVANIYYRKATPKSVSQTRRDSLLKLSLENYFIAKKLNEETGNMINLAHNLNNIGLIYDMQANYLRRVGQESEALNKYNDARNMYLAGLKLNEETGDRESAAGSFINLGNIHSTLKQYALAERFFDSAMVIAKDIGNLDDLKDVYFYLQLKDSAVGDYKAAYQHYKSYTACRDSLLNEENTRKSVEAQMNYEFSKKEATARAEQDKKDAVAMADKKRQNVILLAVTGVGVLILVFALFAYRSFLQKKKANQEISHQKSLIEEKQKEILDSIYYARRIQRSLLPNDKYMSRVLERLRKP